MKIFHGIESYHLGPCALAMGKFDGVHVGHQRLLLRTVELARERGVQSVALTFDRHPLSVLSPGSEPAAISSQAERYGLIEKSGIGALIVCHFTKEFAAMTANDYLSGICAALHPAVIVCGESYTFGRGAEGDAALIERLSGALGYRAEVLKLVAVDGESASSSRVRALLDEGDIDAARRMLGHE